MYNIIDVNQKQEGTYDCVLRDTRGNTNPRRPWARDLDILSAIQ